MRRNGCGARRAILPRARRRVGCLLPDMAMQPVRSAERRMRLFSIIAAIGQPEGDQFDNDARNGE